MLIRKEESDDYPMVKEVNDQAFGQDNEGRLVELLRKNPKFVPELSLVAEVDGKVVGHILFFPIIIKNDNSQFESLALAPMSVIPSHQKKGIGSSLIRKGLAVARSLGFSSVIVLGHAQYYPKFGFEKASKWGIKAPFDVPDEAFMAIELEEGSLRGVNGVVQYHDEFNEV